MKYKVTYRLTDLLVVLILAPPLLFSQETGFEDQCAKLNGHPGKMMLVQVMGWHNRIDLNIKVDNNKRI